MPDIREPDPIPYADLADWLHKSPQCTIPFLGAGVPLSARESASAEPNKQVESDSAATERLLEASGVKQPAARAVIAWASRIAQRLEREGVAQSQAAENDPVDNVLARLVAAETAPSAGELAQLFADRTPYDGFKALGENLHRRLPPDARPHDYPLDELMRVCFDSVGLDAPVGALSSMAALYERKNRRPMLLEFLTSVLATKTKPTLTHRLIARIAALHVARAPANDKNSDYLIITTNYDRLMELALEAEHAPYLVVTARRLDGKVIAAASPDVKDEVLTRELAQATDQFPNNFAPERGSPLVVLYKMHGSIGDGPLAADSVVISDNDYVDCLTWMTRSERMIPALVGELLRRRAFLFLGYSLNDWNVRSFFRGAIDKRCAPEENERPPTKRKDSLVPPDYAVLRTFTDFDRAFFHDNKVTILHTELGQFARGLLRRLPADCQVKL